MWFHIKLDLYYLVSHNSSKKGTCILTCNDMFYYCIKMFLYMYTSGENLNKILNILNLHTVHSKCINDHTLRSDIFIPKCPTHSREMSDKFESQHSLSPTIWSDIVRVDI
jgi:hypothetical protein